jgi:histone deacetylase complex regulatory component SIN3
MNDEDIEKAIESNIKKDIQQEDKIDKSVNEHLGQMGFLWDYTIKKLSSDKICFECKKEQLDIKEKMHVIPTGNANKGLVIFASICNTCYQKLEQIDKGEKNE